MGTTEEIFQSMNMRRMEKEVRGRERVREGGGRIWGRERETDRQTDRQRE